MVKSDSGVGSSDKLLGKSASGVGSSDKLLGKSDSGVGLRDKRLGKSDSGVGARDKRLAKSDSGVGSSDKLLGKSDSEVDPSGKQRIQPQKVIDRILEGSGFRQMLMLEGFIGSNRKHHKKKKRVKGQVRLDVGWEDPDWGEVEAVSQKFMDANRWKP